MTYDVNFLEYGQNAQRLEQTAEAGARFAGENGEYVGTLLVVGFIILCIALVLLLFWIGIRQGKKLL